MVLPQPAGRIRTLDRLLLLSTAMAHYLALAADGDGTLTTRGSMSLATLRGLEQLRSSGRKLLLVTGEKLESARNFPHVFVFHLVVAENGAILFDPATGKHRRLCQPRPARLLPALQARLSCVREGEVAIMCRKSQRHEVEETLRELPSDWKTVPNRRDLIVLPPDVSKATGLDFALQELGLSPSQVAAVGDAENDVPLMECCGLGAAVSNAVPLLKKVANLVLKKASGQGVVELIERMLRDDLPEPEVRRPCATALDDGGLHWLASAVTPRKCKHAAS